jgi:hypothetical protein
MSLSKTDSAALSALQTMKEWRRCSSKQQVFLSALIESDFNFTRATSLAYYGGGNPKNAQIMSFAVRRAKVIRAALGRYDKLRVRVDRESDLAEIQDQIDHAEKGSTSAQRLISEKLRIKKEIELAENEPAVEKQETPKTPKFKVGDIALRADKTKLRVTAVDDQGRVTEGDPVP